MRTEWTPEQVSASGRDADMSPSDAKARERHERESAERQNMAEAHAEGFHTEAEPREFCPECEAAGWTRGTRGKWSNAQ